MMNFQFNRELTRLGRFESENRLDARKQRVLERPVKIKGDDCQAASLCREIRGSSTKNAVEQVPIPVNIDGCGRDGALPFGAQEHVSNRRLPHGSKFRSCLKERVHRIRSCVAKVVGERSDMPRIKSDYLESMRQDLKIRFPLD